MNPKYSLTFLKSLHHNLSLTTDPNLIHPNTCTLAPNLSLLTLSNFFLFFFTTTPSFLHPQQQKILPPGTCSLPFPPSPKKDSLSHSLDLRNCPLEPGLLKPCSSHGVSAQERGTHTPRTDIYNALNLFCHSAQPVTQHQKGRVGGSNSYPPHRKKLHALDCTSESEPLLLIFPIFV